MLTPASQAVPSQAIRSSLLRRLWLCDELVPNTSNRQQMPRAGWFLFNILPQSHNKIINRPRISILAQAPDIFENRTARNDLSFMIDQVAQQISFHQRQIDNRFT